MWVKLLLTSFRLPESVVCATYQNEHRPRAVFFCLMAFGSGLGEALRLASFERRGTGASSLVKCAEYPRAPGTCHAGEIPRVSANILSREPGERRGLDLQGG